MVVLIPSCHFQFRRQLHHVSCRVRIRMGKMRLRWNWRNGNSGMNTKNFLCSPFIHVLLMVGFLLFSLGCPASRDAGSAQKKGTIDSSDATAKPPVPIVAAKESPLQSDQAQLPKRISAAPASAELARETPGAVTKSDYELPGMPVRPDLPNQSSQGSPPSGEESKGELLTADGDTRFNPLRMPSLPVPLANGEGKSQEVQPVSSESQPASFERSLPHRMFFIQNKRRLLGRL